MSIGRVYKNLSGIFPASSVDSAQRKDLNRVVEEIDSNERPKFNLQMPQPLMDEFSEVVKTFGPKHRWVVLSAAVAQFINSSDAVRREWVKRIRIAEIDRNYPELVKGLRDKSANLRKLGDELDDELDGGDDGPDTPPKRFPTTPKPK